MPDSSQPNSLGTLRTSDRSEREAFVDRTYADLFRWFHWLTHDRDQAADLTQATFLSFWKALESGGRSTSARVWLFAIGRNLWRKGCRRWHQEDRLWANASQEDPLAEASAEPSPYEEMNAAECAADIRSAVVELRADLREALTLRYWQDYSYHEIAEVLGVTPEVARQRAFQGRRLLRQRLRAWAPEGSDT